MVLESIGKWAGFDFGDKFGSCSIGFEQLCSFTLQFYMWDLFSFVV